LPREFDVLLPSPAKRYVNAHALLNAQAVRAEHRGKVYAERARQLNERVSALIVEHRGELRTLYHSIDSDSKELADAQISTEERERLRADYKAMRKLLDDRDKAYKTKLGALVSACVCAFS
jgi:predicted aminopeptidase